MRILDYVLRYLCSQLLRKRHHRVCGLHLRQTPTATKMLTSAGVSGIVWPLVAASALLLLILVGVIIRKRRLSHNRQLSGATNLGEAPEQSSSEDEVEQTNTAPASPPPTRTLTPDDIRTINARVRAVLADRFKGPPEVSEDLPISVAEFEGMVVSH